ncbi:MAG: hypothetical protein CME82_11925 [Halomonas sp.]|nr:hypothetical protein [Halomonas sp.]|tara:strand:- start:672 stop:1550 length:879 start_codon:yes stop_codon:yes gene_type:complete
MNAKPMLALTAALWLGTTLVGCSDDNESETSEGTSQQSENVASGDGSGSDVNADSAGEDDTSGEQGNDISAMSPADRREALEQSLRANFDPQLGEIRYLVGWSDLNDDGQDEAVVHVVGPMVCGTGGCDTLILEAQDDAYRVISAQPTTQPPIQLGEASHEGWRDLVVKRHLAADQPAQALHLRFDGSSYVEAEGNEGEAENATVLIEDFNSLDDARPLFTGEGAMSGSLEGDMEGEMEEAMESESAEPAVDPDAASTAAAPQGSDDDQADNEGEGAEEGDDRPADENHSGN